MKLNYLQTLLGCVALLLTFNATAQDSKAARLNAKAAQIKSNDAKVSSVEMNEDRETPFMITFDTESEEAYTLEDAQRLIESKLGVKKSTEKIQYSKTIELPKSGMEVQRFEQYYQGVKVEHGDYVAMAAKGKLNLITGEYYELDNINTVPSLTEEQALEAAKKFIGAQNYAWDVLIENFNGVIAPEYLGEWRAYYNEYWPAGEVVIVDNYGTKDLDLDLAYRFNVYATNPLSRDYVYVNAHTGKIMFKNPIIKHFQRQRDEAIGTGGFTAPVPTRYSKTQEIGTTEINLGYAGGLATHEEPNPLFDNTGGVDLLMDSRAIAADQVAFQNALSLSPGYDADGLVYVLIDQTRDQPGGTNTIIETYDVNGLGGAPLSLPIYGQARSFTDDDNTWTLDEHDTAVLDPNVNPAEREYQDDVAWDAHWGATMVYDYWRDVHGRDSYDGLGASILSYIHIGNAYDNAFWNGSVMSYGDGQSFKSLTALDVCGHEVGHAICSTTSDLVYAKQSGGMNEGFSDIWGACIEYFVLKDQPDLGHPNNTDPEANGGYRPFGIGEQIDNPGEALRWMDAPKVAGDPDTFDGDNWSETEDCDPSLANDQCGVHSNSGVLNKWFYLMVVGSGAGSGVDAEFAGTGANADDSMNDNGEAYSVNGIGFLVAEQIAFGAEVLLTPNSTFADCRVASIAVARAMSDQNVTSIDGSNPTLLSGGFCGDIETSVTNAWHGVGVGTAFDCAGLDQLEVGFISSTGLTVEGAAGAVGCEPTTEVVVNYFMNGLVDYEVTVAGSAVEGVDYNINLPNNRVTNTSGYVNTSFTIEIIDDAIIEPSETIELTFTAGSLADFDSHIITINDNDVVPTIGTGTVTLLQEQFDNGIPGDWTPDYSDGNVMEWYGGFPASSTSSVAYASISSADCTYEGTASAVNQDIRLITKKIDGRGMTDINVSFDYIAGGERDAGINATPYDYGELMYSFDLIEFTSTGEIFAGDGSVSPLVPVIGTFNDQQGIFDGKEFYLVFRWYNDPLVGGGYAFSFDNLVVTGKPVEIETALSEGTTERVDNGSTVYFLSDDDGEIVADINATGGDLSCIEANVAQAGSDAVTLTDGMRTRKAFSITGAPAGVAHIVSIYYTDEELDGFPDGDVASLKMTQITGDIAQDSPDGVSIDMSTTAYEAIMSPDPSSPGVIGHKYSSPAFTGSGKYSVTNATQETTGILAVDLIDLTATPKADVIQLDWTTATETENKGFYIERQIEGTRIWETIGFVEGNGTTSTANRYFHTDATVKAGVIYLYRLAQEDFNGSINNSKVVRAQLNGKDVAYDITPNPANDHVNVRFYTNVDEKATITLLSVAGQALSQTVTTSDVNTTRIDLSNYPSGVYFVKVETTQGAKVDRIVKR